MEFKKLKELVEINSESITKNYKETIINYLDTSNITNGKIDSIVEIIQTYLTNLKMNIYMHI